MVVSMPDALLLKGEKKLSVCVLLLLLKLFLEGAEAVPNAADVEKHLELGKQFLARNQLANALKHFHEAVEADSNNYLTLFRRGTVYFAMSKTRFAIQDFSKVLELKPDFTIARLQRGLVYMKNGDYNEAAEDLVRVLQEDLNNHVASEHLARVEPAKEQWEIVQDLMNRGDYKSAIEMLSQLLEISPFSVKIREARSDAYMANNDALSAISDLRSVNKMSQDSTEGYYKIALLLYAIGHVSNSLKEIRECLKLDPDHKACFSFYKTVRKVEKGLSDAEQQKQEKQYAECIKSAESALKYEKDEIMVIFEAKRLLCSCYKLNEEYSKALEPCKEALDIKKDTQIYCDRGDALIGLEMYDDALHDFQDALNTDDTSQRAKEGIEKAKRLQKDSERRDYYKILGVKRDATKQEIVKAYRKAAQKWHPDNFQGADKKVAEKKFIDIAAAKEVLTNAEKRKQFDQGHDPLDPEGQQGGNWPFTNFQYGSPFKFRFHFN